MDILKDIDVIINIIGNILIYFVPGFIFFKIRNIKLARPDDGDKLLILKSIVLSYILNEIFNKLIPTYICHIKINKDFLILYEIVFVLMVSFIYYKTNAENKLLNKLGIKSKNVNFLDDIIPKNNCIWVELYLKDEDVIVSGEIVYYHYTPETKDTKLDVFNYIIYDYDDKIIDDSSIDDSLRMNGELKGNHIIIDINNIKRFIYKKT